MIRYENVHKVFGTVDVLKGISFEIPTGKVVCILGPSGSGKTTLLRCTNYLETPTQGVITVGDKTIDALHHTKKDVQDIRKHSTMVFQNYNLFRNKSAIENVMAGLTIVQKKDKKEARDIAEHFLNVVGMGNRMAYYPSQLSGGQQQRVGIARALAVKPEFIVCDEPISALDVSIQSQVVNMLEDMQAEMGLTYLFIAHDLSVVRHISNRIGVMYLGSLVELGESYELNRHPIHPYTQTLLSAVPVPDPKLSRTRKRIILEGDVPSPMNPPSGCRFHTRCPYATQKCREEMPQFKEHEPGHWAACHLLDK